MILATRNGNREAFARFDSSVPIPRPSQWGGSPSWSGERVTFENATAVPAFLRGVRLISETAAGLPMQVFRGFDEDMEPQPGVPQQALLRKPNEDQSPFGFWQYLFTSLIRGNAYIWKVKVRSRIVALYPVNPALVTPKYRGSGVEFDIRESEFGPVKQTVGKDKLIHIPGILLEDPYVGVSVVHAHRHELGSSLARQKFEGRYLASDGRPGVVLKHEGSPTKEQRDAIREGYESRHGGPMNAGRPGMLWGGWDIDSLPVSLEDAQFIESKNYSVQDIGRMLGVPPGLLGEPESSPRETPEQENMRFLKHGLQPWMDRIEDGIGGDSDLFPNSDWSVAFNVDGFLRADILTRWDAYRLGRQGGWITANEIRSKEGLAPVDGGDEIQQTPVGGAANSSNNLGDANAAD